MIQAEDTIPCRTCKQTGYEPLPESHLRVVRVLEAAPGSLSAPEVWKKLGEKVNPSAINNRLEDLRRWHYVGRVRDGKRWMYWSTRVRPPRPPEGSCPRSPGEKHQLITYFVGELRVCLADSPDSD